MKFKPTIIYIIITGILLGIYGGFSDLIDMPLRIILLIGFLFVYLGGALILFFVTNKKKKG